MYSSALMEVENVLSDGKSQDSFTRCESASLRLEKFVHIGDNSKKDEIAAVVSRSPQKVPAFLPPNAVRFVAKLGGRLIVNQAGGVLENAGLCLHPHFNAPYIPGSALKGVARHAAWCAWNEEEDDTRKSELAKEIAEIFGYPTGDKGLDDYLAARGCDQKRSGSVCFMPAYPESTARLVADIVNCHHPKYYSGDAMFPDAADVESPIPNFFPAVERDSRFVFILVPLHGGNVERAKTLLVEALSVNGVGAKTAAGYGWFEYSQEENDVLIARQRHLVEIKKLKQRLEDLDGRISALRGRAEPVLSDESVQELDAIERGLDLIPKEPELQHGRDLLVVACRELDKRRPVLSPEQIVAQSWSGQMPSEVVRSRYILCFSQLSVEEKAGVVRMLRTHELWKILRTGNYGDDQLNLKKKKQIEVLRGQVESIRAFAKTMPEGKMP